MNSVNLANKVWKQIKMYSILPTKPLLEKIVKDEAPEGTPEFVVKNAYDRVCDRMDKTAAAMKVWQKNQEDQENLNKLHALLNEPIKEGSLT